MSPASRITKTASIPPPIDATIRSHVRTLIRSLASVPSRDTPRQTHVILNAIWQFISSANMQLLEGKQEQALMTLQAVTDVLTLQGMHLNDIHSEVSDFFEELASTWTETLLSVELTAKERTMWAKRLTAWQTRIEGWSIKGLFDAPQAALREGWNQPALQRILQGTSPHQSLWEGEIPVYANMLTHARLTVLEYRKQFQEYLSLAKAAGYTKEYITMLARQEQSTEALSSGLQQLTRAEDALEVAQALFAHHEPSASLQIAAHGLTLEGTHVPLAIWLRGHAWSLGEPMLALEAGNVAFREEPTLQHYLSLEMIAGTHWPEQRALLLEYARHAPWTAEPRGLLRIFLHEHLFDDAIAVLQPSTSYSLVALVVDAALHEQTALDWVIEACRKEAEHIMNGAKATYYQAAATWLTKARTAYHLVGRDEHWQAYRTELLERHRHKSKLFPLLTAL